MYRIGIDVHGVIDKDSEFAKKHMKKFINIGVEIYIISGPPVYEIKQELFSMGIIENIHYNKVLSIVDHLRSKNVEMWLDHKNTWWADESYWWRSKSEICEKMNIDIMIDNTETYKPYFKDIKTKFVLWS